MSSLRASKPRFFTDSAESTAHNRWFRGVSNAGRVVASIVRNNALGFFYLYYCGL